MSDMITLSDSTRKTHRKPDSFREKKNDDAQGSIRYRRRQIEDKDAEQEIKEYERENDSGTDRVY